MLKLRAWRTLLWVAAGLLSGHALTQAARADPPGTLDPDLASERQVTILIGDDFSALRSDTYVLLRDPDGQTTTLLLSKAHLDLQRLALRSRHAEPSIREKGTPEVHRVAAIILSFATASATCSHSQVEAALWDSPEAGARVLADSSYGALVFPKDGNGDGQPDIFGPFVVPYPPAPCDVDAWTSAAISLAVASGLKIEDYEHLLFFLPDNPCPWAGLAQLGAPREGPAFAWAKMPSSCNPPTPRVIAHELGHNLGFHHSTSDIIGSGYPDEYGDQSDFMGSGGYLAQTNAPHRVEAGWLPPDKLVDVSGGGDFVIAPLELDPASTPLPQVLRVDGWLYLSSRRAIGTSSRIPTRFVGTTSVHRQSIGSPEHLGSNVRSVANALGGSRHVKTGLLGSVGNGQTLVVPGLSITQTRTTASETHVTIRSNQEALEMVPIERCPLIVNAPLPTAFAQIGHVQVEAIRPTLGCGINSWARGIVADVTVDFTSPGSLSVIPFGGPITSMQSVFGGPGLVRALGATLEPSAAGSLAFSYAGQQGGTYSIDVLGYLKGPTHPCDDGYEAGNNWDHPVELEAPGEYNLTLCDPDYFRFAATPGGRYRVRVSSPAGGDGAVFVFRGGDDYIGSNLWNGPSSADVSFETVGPEHITIHVLATGLEYKMPPARYLLQLQCLGGCQP